jgi:hypothetical protein
VNTVWSRWTGCQNWKTNTQEQQNLITDLFERIILFDLKVEETTVSETIITLNLDEKPTHVDIDP